MPFLSLLLIAFSLSFQTGAAPKKVVPVGEEPRHHIKFENKYVRVIDAVVAAGDTTLYHTHSRDNVPIAIEGGSLKIALAGSGQPPAEQTVEVGRTTWAPGEYTHQITNTGKTRVRFIDAEVVSSPGLKSDTTLTGIAGHTLIFENDRVRAYRVTLQPGQSTGAHKHGLSFLNVSVSGGDLLVENADKKATKQKIKPGAFAWFDGPLTHSVKNGGAAPYEMVDLELK